MPARRRQVFTLLVAAGVVAVAAAVAAAPPAVPHGLRSSPPAISSPTAQPSVEIGRTRFVAPSGSDRGPGTDARPWGTLQHALSALRAGDRLEMAGGEYREVVRVDAHPGTSELPVTVIARPGERPVLRGLMRMTGADYWTFDGLNVTWDPDAGSRNDHMVKLIDGVGWTWSNSEVWGAESYAGILVVGTVSGEPASWTIRDSCIHSTARANPGAPRDHNLYLNPGPSSGPGRVERNVLFGAPNGMNIKVGGPSSGSGGAADIVIRYNTMAGADQAVLVNWSASGTVLERNLVGGLVSENPAYGAFRGFELTGDGNVVRNNAVFGAPRAIYNDEASSPGLEDGGGNIEVEPRFNRTDSCDGYRPLDAAASGYGEAAP